MATEVDWNNVGGKERNTTRFVKFTEGKTVVFRPIGGVVEFIKFFVETPTSKRSVCVDVENADEAATILAERGGKEYKPSHRFATNVLDRADGLIYVLEGGPTIFESFANWAKASGTKPGSNGGGDWSITAKGPNNLSRRYTTTFIKQTPVSEEEKANIKSNGGVYVLTEVFKSTPLDQLVKIAFGDADEPQAETEPQTASAASSSDDILF